MTTIAVFFLCALPGFVLARLSAVAPLILVAALFAIPADEARADSGHPDGNYSLHCAAGVDNNLAAVIHLLGSAHGKNVNERDADSASYPCSSRSQYGRRKTPLHQAASHGHATIAATLIAAGADVNAKDNDRRETPLHRAADRGRVSVVSVLLAAGADVNAKDKDRDTPLHRVAIDGDGLISVISMLLEVGADVNVKNRIGETPLHYAVWGEEVSVVFFLLEAGADVNAEDNHGETPLREAYNRENAFIVSVLAAAGGHWGMDCMGAATVNPAGPTPKCLCESPNIGNANNCQVPSAESCADYTPPRLYDASAGECGDRLHPCHATAVRKDDNSGCECPPARPFSHGDPSSGYYGGSNNRQIIPATAACYADHAPIVHNPGGWLDSIQADNPTLILHFISEHNESPNQLAHAIQHSAHRAVKVLIDRGANVNQKYSGGDTPLHFAAEKTDAPENAALISLLLAGGADPNIRNNDEWHPLDLAYHGGNIRLSNGVFARTPKRLLMSALVAGGGNLAQPDGQDGNGDSPLHFETRAGRDEFVLWVLNRGANPDIANNKSETPMHHAAGDFSLPLVKLLAERGANPDKQDEDGDSPMHKIARGTDAANNTALISLLLDKGANPNLKNNDGWRPLDLAFDDGGERDPRFARRMLMLALIEGGAQWTSECFGGAIPNENYRGLAQVATYPECKCPAHISQRDGGGACECPAHSHSQVNGRCLPQGSAEVDSEIAKMQAELSRLRAALDSLNARISLSAEMPREMVEGIAEQARETAAEIDWRRANFIALGRTSEAGAAPPPVALSDTAAECRMRGGEVRIDSGSGTRICLGLDQSGTFCLVDSGHAFPCRGLFKHVRLCNDAYNRPALNPFICAERCDADETARGKDCE